MSLAPTTFLLLLTIPSQERDNTVLLIMMIGAATRVIVAIESKANNTTSVDFDEERRREKALSLKDTAKSGFRVARRPSHSLILLYVVVSYKTILVEYAVERRPAIGHNPPQSSARRGYL